MSPRRTPYTAVSRLLLALLTALLLAQPTMVLAAPGSIIVVGGDQNYPPYEFLDKERRPTGFNVELTRTIAEVMGLEVEIRPLGRWDQVRRLLEDGEVDLVVKRFL